MASRKQFVIFGVCLFVMCAILAGVGVHLWQQHKKDFKEFSDKVVTVSLAPELNVFIMGGGKPVYLVYSTVTTPGRYKELGAQLASTNTGRAKPCGKMCVVWEDGSKLTVKPHAKKATDKMDCVTMLWNVSSKAALETPTDCFDMSHSQWYGAFEDHFQYWDMRYTKLNFSAYVTGEVFDRVEYGEVIEPLFISSLGMGIHVDVKAPLHLTINGRNPKANMCLKGRTAPDSAFYGFQDTPWISYDLCRASNVAVLWKEMSKAYIPKPRKAPAHELIQAPIWSTWARYKAYINQTSALGFAKEIVENNMTISQLEIDDDWTPFYGDFDFNTNKFPDAAEMVNELKAMGIPTTVWMHPFLNNNSNYFKEASKMGYLVKNIDSDKPALVKWWRTTSKSAGLIDFTNDDAVKWYLKKLEDLRVKYNVSSFKFDAGEVSYLPEPGTYSFHQKLTSPNDFTTRYVNTACKSDMNHRRQEVRSAFRSQECHTLVRMLDRKSDWGHELGLRTLIPTALAFGLAGYPFVLPDMIGGNAYNESDIDQTVLPEPELYIRWLQTTLFMPTLQFSIAPWDYHENTEVLAITQKMLKLREKYIDKIIDLMDNAVATGEPIVRPLWWKDPTDEQAAKSETQFLLGDDILVAPVLEKGARQLDVYIPSGVWKDQINGKSYTGRQWLKGYKADLDQIPHFVRETKRNR